MITTRQAVVIGHGVESMMRRLSDTERDQLARSAIMINEVRTLTLDRGYYLKALELLRAMAPSLADELNELLDTVEELRRRIST